MKRALSGLASTVVIAAAAWMWHGLPTPDEVYGSFDVHAGTGQRATGDTITAQVTGVRIGPRIQKKQYRPLLVDAVGTWVAVDAEAMTIRADDVPTVELLVGPNTYVPTNRLGFTALTGNLTPGIAVRSSWIFDVPPQLVASGSPPMTLRVWVDDWRQDSRLVITIPLDGPRVQRTDVIPFGPATQVGT